MRVWYPGQGSISLGTAVVVVGGGVRMAISRSIRITSVGKRFKKIYVRENSRCVMIAIWGTLRGT